VLDRERIRGKAAASQGTGGSGGGSVDETQKRLTAVETTQAETKIILQGLATKTELSEFRSEARARLGAIETLLPHLATKADLNRVEGTLATAIANLHASMIKWVVGTGLGCMALAVGIARSFR
jgi:hypothetical protein